MLDQSPGKCKPWLRAQFLIAFGVYVSSEVRQFPLFPTHLYNSSLNPTHPLYQSEPLSVSASNTSWQAPPCSESISARGTQDGPVQARTLEKVLIPKPQHLKLIEFSDLIQSNLSPALQLSSRASLWSQFTTHKTGRLTLGRARETLHFVPKATNTLQTMDGFNTHLLNWPTLLFYFRARIPVGLSNLLTSQSIS